MYAIVDIETTGGKYNEEGITEIAIHKFDGHQIVDSFISLVNPERSIQPFVVNLTGINNQMLRSAPKFYEVAKRIIEITENSVIVAHNSKFDYRILRTEFKRLGYEYERESLCTVELSKKLIPDLDSYKLGKLCRTLGIPVADMIITMRLYYPSMEKLLFLSENTTTSRKEKQLLDTLFSRVGVNVAHELVDDFDQWKIIFKEANQSFDIIYLPTNGAIKGWDRDEAISFISQHIKIPVVTTEDFMMPYAVFGLTKVAKEQGIWVAVTAKKILKGSKITDFPVTRNKESTYWLNTSLAEKIGFEPDTVLLSKLKMMKN